MVDLETFVQASAIMGGIVSASAYLGRRSLYLWEKRNNISNGIYASLLESSNSDFWHKFYKLGTPSEVVVNYLKEEKSTAKNSNQQPSNNARNN